MEKGPNEFWKPFEGVPLCHVPSTPEEERELLATGACRCG